MTIRERMHRRFSEEFKKEIVLKIESKEVSIGSVSTLYEVKMENVKRWVKKYGKEPLPTSIIITSSSEINRVKDLEKESNKLKQVIGEQHLRIVYLEQCLTLAKEKLGDNFEKKTKF